MERDEDEGAWVLEGSCEFEVLLLVVLYINGLVEEEAEKGADKNLYDVLKSVNFILKSVRK